MSKLFTGIVGVLAVAGAIGVFRQYRVNADLRGEMATFREQSDQLGKLRTENERLAKTANEVAALRAANAELGGLRREVGDLKQRNDDLSRQFSRRPEPKPVVADEPRASLQPGMLAAETWRNVGHGTPEAAFQTMLWAAMGGDVELHAKSITFTPESRAKIETLFATLPDNLRAQYGTPERMVSSFMSSDMPFAGMQVLGHTMQGTDTALLDTQWQYANGQVRENQWQFQRGSDGQWRQVIPAPLFDKWATMLRSGRVPPAKSGNK